MDLERVERELKKRWSFPYQWGRRQADDWDKKTNFIYTTYSFKKLLAQVANHTVSLQNYAMNRWYNYWSAMAVEAIFTSHDSVQANINKYDKKVDFTINTISFDHKTTVFPKGFNKSMDYAMAHKRELIQWLYENQSQQGRKHLANRLFIVLLANDAQHWKLKAEVMLLKQVIMNYLQSFNKENLEVFDFGEGQVFSDIIWLKN